MAMLNNQRVYPLKHHLSGYHNNQGWLILFNFSQGDLMPKEPLIYVYVNIPSICPT